MYCTADDLTNRFGLDEMIALSDKTDTGQIDLTVISRAIDDASGLINGYLQSRYQLPLMNTPSIVTRLCIDLSRYYLYDDDKPESLIKTYESSIKILKDISNGSMSLGLNNNGGKPTSNNNVVMTSSGKIFKRSSF